MIQELNRNWNRSTLGSSLLALGAAATLALTGCSDSFSNAITGTGSATAGALLTGNVHGGRQPISNATVTVYAMGKNGYGSAGAALASTKTDTNGNFTFGPGSGNTYACPAATSTTLSQNLYIVANGGNPNGANGSSNATTYLMTVLQGNCNTVVTTQPQIVINELTTIASMFALQQFFSPGATVSGTFGTSATNSQGLLNAIATAGNLINLPSGVPVASSTTSGAVTGYTTNPTITITPEEAKLDSLADILAACVNTDGSATNNNNQPTNCYTLFNGVSSPAVSDTLQAAYYLATNPTSVTGTTSNITSLYNLTSATSPYQPTLSAVPTDWTVGVTYGSTASQTVSGTSVYLLTKPENLAIDSTGNVWISNYVSTTIGTLGNSLTELSPTGTPLKQAFTTGQLAGAFSIAIDPSNDVYLTNYGKSGGLGTTVVEYTAAGATNSFTTGAGPTAVASDGAGNIFIPTTSATGGAADLESIAAGSASGTRATVVSTGVVDSSFSEIAIDSNETLYVSDASTTSKGTTQFLNVPGTTTFSGTLTAVGGQGQVEPLAIDNGNKVWAGSYSNSTNNAGQISNINANATGTNFASSTAVTVATDPALNYIEKLAIDGAGDVWVATQTATAGGVSEFTNTGGILSPVNTVGFAHTYSGANKVAIDGSGNVWIGNSATAASATVPAFITEIVGQASPVVTPIAAGLPITPGGTNRLGSRP